MATDDRKPLTRAERREVFRGFRFTESEDRALQDGAAADGVDFSTYVRGCALTGHRMRVADRLMKKAGA